MNVLLRALRISWIAIIGFGVIITSSILLSTNSNTHSMTSQIEIGLAISGIVIVLLGFYHGINKIFDEPDELPNDENAQRSRS